MMLKAIVCVQHFCSFGAMLFIEILLMKTDSTVKKKQKNKKKTDSIAAKYHKGWIGEVLQH